jgi:uncharacterized damage-inducible protein DinB
MKRIVRFLPLFACAALASAQDVTMAALRSLYEGQQANIVAAAEKMRDSDLEFRPSHDVMSTKAILAHLGDVNYSICASLKGEKSPSAGAIEKRIANKAELLTALNESYAYCGGVLGGMKDANLAETYQAGQTTRTKAWHALHLLEHMTLHYGNIITYMRIRGMVPPETERRQRMQKK